MGIVLFNIEVFILLIVTVWGPSLFFQLSQLFRFLLCRFIKETFFLFQIQQSLQLSKWWHVWLLLHSEIVLLGTWWEWVNIINVNMFNPTMIINNALLQFKNSCYPRLRPCRSSTTNAIFRPLPRARATRTIGYLGFGR